MLGEGAIEIKYKQGAVSACRNFITITHFPHANLKNKIIGGAGHDGAHLQSHHLSGRYGRISVKDCLPGLHVSSRTASAAQMELVVRNTHCPLLSLFNNI